MEGGERDNARGRIEDVTETEEGREIEESKEGRGDREDKET